VAVIVILLLVGAALMLLETLLPGLVAGAVGFCCLIAAVVVGYVNFGPRTGNAVLVIVVIGLVVGTACWIRYFPDSRMAQVFISKGSIGNINAEQPELLNQTGTALTQLRPSGMAKIDGRRVDVVTEGNLIEKGATVKVVGIEGIRVVVREVV